MTLTKGQHVVISAAAGTCPGEVLHIEEPATLPSISGAPEADRVRAIMTKWGIAEVALITHRVRAIMAGWAITELALITYQHNGRDITFIALGDGAGQWRDLKRQPLTITPIHGEWEIQEPTT
jgi:hypothetical protein